MISPYKRTDIYKAPDKVEYKWMWVCPTRCGNYMWQKVKTDEIPEEREGQLCGYCGEELENWTCHKVRREIIRHTFKPTDIKYYDDDTGKLLWEA